MRVLALVTARSGSKRLPGKNTKNLGGKPLINWSIEVARGITDICDILVSTDDSVIADIARLAGGLVPWLRPADLSTDTSTSIDVALHALNWYEKSHGVVDGLMLLQPTSPFRTKATIRKAIEIFLANDCRSVVSVSPAASHPAWCYRIERNALSPLNGNEKGSANQRSQDLPPVYTLNGAMYLATPVFLRDSHTFFDDDAYPLIIDNPIEALDIDTAHDFMIAECIATEKI